MPVVQQQILEGGRETLKRHTPVILIGTAMDDNIRYLAGLGYRLYRYDRASGKLQPAERSETGSFFLTEDKLRLLA